MLKNSDEDTIVAISTPLGEGGIGIVRLSGTKALAIADGIFESKSKKRPSQQAAFTVQVGHVISKAASGLTEVVDEAMVLVMRAPKSYTGEDVVEISAHGGKAVLQKILDCAVRSSARLAERGEFTQRAFLNGRIDLLQAEAVLDLIQAKTELARRWAATQLDGFLSRKIGQFKEGLLDILANLEASIDFSEDAPGENTAREITARLKVSADKVDGLLKNADVGIFLKRGLDAVICGKPNVGKSSLMNQLARSNRVIVTPYAGTTRDVVCEEIQIRGFPVRLLDTAGIQETDHPIEKEGIERSRKALSGADLVLFVLDASQGLSAEDAIICAEIGDRKAIAVLNKCDLPRITGMEQAKNFIKSPNTSFVEISCSEGRGIETLEDKVYSIISGGMEISEDVAVSSVRQKDLLQKASTSLKNAYQASAEGMSPEFVAVDVRTALDHLGVLVGEVVTDDILNSIFSRFCVGK